MTGGEQAVYNLLSEILKMPFFRRLMTRIRSWFNTVFKNRKMVSIINAITTGLKQLDYGKAE